MSLSEQPNVLQQTDVTSNNELAIRLKDRYELVEKIGRGGMGSVWKAKQLTTGQIVAVKLINESIDDDDKDRKRFELEMKAIRALFHPNLVKLIDYGYTDDGRPFLVQEFIPGQSLQQLLQQKKHLSEPEMIDIFCKVCQGLSHVHEKGFVHRDLKPSNVMIGTDGVGETYVKIVDFGIAKSQRQTQSLTDTGAIIGSPLYMSPEQALGQAVDPRSDIYSLGCMLYEAATGVPPFQGSNPMQTLMQHIHQDPRPFEQASPFCSVSPALESVVLRALDRDINKRLQTAASLYAELRRLERSAPPAVATNDRVRRLFSEGDRLSSPQSTATWIGAVLMLAIAGTIYAFTARQSKQAHEIVLAKQHSSVAAVRATPPKPHVTKEESTKQALPARSKPLSVSETPKKPIKIIPLPADIQEMLASNRQQPMSPDRPPLSAGSYFAESPPPNTSALQGYQPEWLLKRGDELLQRGDYQDALPCFMAASDKFRSSQIWRADWAKAASHAAVAAESLGRKTLALQYRHEAALVSEKLSRQ